MKYLVIPIFITSMILVWLDPTRMLFVALNLLFIALVILVAMYIIDKVGND